MIDIYIYFGLFLFFLFSFNFILKKAVFFFIVLNANKASTYDNLFMKTFLILNDLPWQSYKEFIVNANNFN